MVLQNFGQLPPIDDEAVIVKKDLTPADEIVSSHLLVPFMADYYLEHIVWNRMLLFPSPVFTVDVLRSEFTLLEQHEPFVEQFDIDLYELCAFDHRDTVGFPCIVILPLSIHVCLEIISVESLESEYLLFDEPFSAAAQLLCPR